MTLIDLRINLLSSRSRFPQIGKMDVRASVHHLLLNTDGGRYDMLCHEGISLMLNIFRGKASIPNYRVVAPANGEAHQITVHQEVSHTM